MPTDLVAVDAVAEAGHAVSAGVWCGVPCPTDELPIRAAAVRTALRAAGVPLVAPPDAGLGPLRAVHDEALLALLATAHERWLQAGHDRDPGAPDAVPYLFPAVAGPARRPRGPLPIRVELGAFAMDTMTPIGAGTWAAARSAADAAVHAADLLATRRRALAVTRPPGHHAGRRFFGGSCYLNHAAIAAARLRAAGCGRVAILDLDAHHGNGTQDVFWDDASVLFASVHVDPGAGWFPYTCGFADERDATDTTVNLPLPPGTGDEGYAAATAALCDRIRAFAPDALVVSLGVDAAAEDPNSPLRVTTAGFAEVGARVLELDRPTVYVLEGGYVPDTLGRHVLAALRGEERAP